jgi:hypothetical protein
LIFSKKILAFGKILCYTVMACENAEKNTHIVGLVWKCCKQSIPMTVPDRVDDDGGIKLMEV